MTAEMQLRVEGGASDQNFMQWVRSDTDEEYKAAKKKHLMYMQRKKIIER